MVFGCSSIGASDVSGGGARMVSPEREEETKLDCSSWSSTSFDSSTAPVSKLSTIHWLLMSWMSSFETKSSSFSSGRELWKAMVSCCTCC